MEDKRLIPAGILQILLDFANLRLEFLSNIQRTIILFFILMH